MSDQGEQSRSTLIQVVVWSIAAPILSVWALVSLLPLVSLIRAWGSLSEAFIALAFLATSAAGLAAGAVVYRWLLSDRTRIATASPEARTLRAVTLSAYALVWMALYAL